MAIGLISGFCRSPALKCLSCLTGCTTACWPARFGHSGFALLPSMPWQAMQVADLAWPASTVPAAVAEPVQPSTAASVRAATNFAVMSENTPKNPRRAPGRAEKPGNSACSAACRASRKLYTKAFARRGTATHRQAAWPPIRTSDSSPARTSSGSCRPTRGVEVAVAGRSNAGKSSAINAITQRKGLARTSKSPGATRLLNFFELEAGPPAGRPAGLRLRQGLGRHARPLGHACCRGTSRSASRCGARSSSWTCAIRSPTTTRTMLELASSRGLPVHILLTKADKLGRGAAGNALQAVRRKLPQGRPASRCSCSRRCPATACTKRAARWRSCSTGR